MRKIRGSDPCDMLTQMFHPKFRTVCVCVCACAAVLPKRVTRQRHLPFLEACISKRGAADGDVEALEVLIKSASERGSQGRLDVSNPRSGPGGRKRSCAVDFGGLEFVEFEMSPEMAERTVVKRIGPREEAPRPISTTLQAHVFS